MNIAILDANTLGPDINLDQLQDLGHLSIYGFTPPEKVKERIKDAHVIICNKSAMNEATLCEASQLKLICLTATGSDNVDKSYTKSKKIIVSNVVGYSTDSVAQHTFAMLFYLYEQMAYYDKYVKSGSYVGDDTFSHFSNTFHDLAGKTWGIIGLGAIGKKVAHIAQAFGSKVIYYSTSGKNINKDFEQVTLDQLLEASDIISIHAPLTGATDHLITLGSLKKMKPTSILLNLGRGRIVCEDDLAKALDLGLIAGAGIDVLEKEPMIENHPFLSLNNPEKLLVTPHVAWASIEARNRVIHEVRKNIESFLEGTPRNSL